MKKLALAFTLTLAAAPALAHPGHDFGLTAGLLHPLTGADHLAAMLAVGRDRALDRGIAAGVTFLNADAERLPLPDRSQDTVSIAFGLRNCTNKDKVLAEARRVLRPGGIAGFSEPGPDHSKAPHSQFEMQHYVAVENDVVMRDIWAWAQRAGFTEDRKSTRLNSSHT